MAIQADMMTRFGERRTLYIRLNNVAASNHGVKDAARFRGFLSRQAFLDGAHYIYDSEEDGPPIRFDGDIEKSLWSQAYAALEAEADENGEPIFQNIKTIDPDG